MMITTLRMFAALAVVGSMALPALELARDGKVLVSIYALPEESALMAAGETLPKPHARLTYGEIQRLMLKQAMSDLRDYLQRLSGGEVAVLAAASLAEVRYPAIVVGTLAAPELRLPESPTREGFALRVTAEGAWLAGESPAGTAFAVYELLEKLGCAWVMPGANGEVCPSRPNLALEPGAWQQSPSFEIRCPWYTTSAKTMTAEENVGFSLWKLRNKLQISRDIHPLQMVGGHAWSTLTRIYKDEFEADPEMYALVRQPDGSLKRQGPQVETTNPKVLALFERYIREMFAKNGWPADKKVNISVGPADGGGYSESHETLAVSANRRDPISGSADLTDVLVLLCNQLLERLEPEYPNLYLSFYLYSWHADYPLRYKPHPRLALTIADISYSRLHENSSGKSFSRAYYNGILEKWGKLAREQGNPIIMRGYNWNLADNILPFTTLKMYGENLPFYHRFGVLGAYTESIKNWSANGPGDYLEARLLWQVGQKWQDVLGAYCRLAYGSGGAAMERYFLALAERQSGSYNEAGSYFGLALIHDRVFLRQCEELLAEAARAAAADGPGVRERVRQAAIPMRNLRDFLDFRDAYCAYDFQTAERVYEAMLARLQEESGRDSYSVCRGGSVYLRRYYDAFIKTAVAHSGADSEMVFRFPDRMKVMLDPNDVGEQFRYYDPDWEDGDFLQMKTFTSTLGLQGLDAYRSGSIWYRVRFFVPAALAGRRIGLCLGGGDMIFKTYLNGWLAGQGIGQLKPFVYDLTPWIRFGAENSLVIRSQRRSMSELSVGGLMMPSFVFAADKIVELNNTLTESERILPGGAREAIR